MEQALQTLLDKEEIREVTQRWSRAMDLYDWDLFDQATTEDLESDFTALGLPRVDRTKLKELLEMSKNYFDMMQHIISNLTFHELTSERARTTVMVSSWTRPIGGEAFQTNGWYHDELRKTPEGWRIAKRTMELIFSTQPNAGEAPAAQEMATRQ